MHAEDPSTTARSGRQSLSPYRHPQMASPQQQQQQAQQQQHPSSYGPTKVMQFEPSSQYEDVWVTVYGFTQVRVHVLGGIN